MYSKLSKPLLTAAWILTLLGAYTPTFGAIPDGKLNVPEIQAQNVLLSANVHPVIAVSFEGDSDTRSSIEIAACTNGCDLTQLREILSQYPNAATEISLLDPSGISQSEAISVIKKITQAAPAGSTVRLVNVDIELVQTLLAETPQPNSTEEAQNKAAFLERFKAKLQNWRNTAKQSWASLTDSKKDLAVAVIKSAGGVYVFITTGDGSGLGAIAAASSFGVDTFFGLFGVKYPEFKRRFAFFGLGQGNTLVEWAKGKIWAKAIGIDTVVSTLIQGYFRLLTSLQNPNVGSPFSFQWLEAHFLGNITGILMGAPAEQTVLEMHERGKIPNWAKWMILQGWNVLGSAKGWLVATPMGSTSWGAPLLTSLIVLDSATKLTTIGLGLAVRTLQKKYPRFEVRIRPNSVEPNQMTNPESLLPSSGCEDPVTN